MSEFVKLYCTDIDTLLTDAEYQKGMRMISCEKAERLNRFHFEKDRLRSLYGEIMLRGCVRKLFGCTDAEMAISYSSYGKPYFANLPQVHFNLSHSGSYVLCGISHAEIGVDIELIGTHHLDIAKRYFTAEEYEQIIAQPPSEQPQAFYRYWCLKESYIKYKGLGMYLSLDAFQFQKDASGFHVMENGTDCGVQVYEKQYAEQYMTAAVYHGEGIQPVVQYENIHTYLQWTDIENS